MNSDLSQIRPRTWELAALEHLEKTLLSLFLGIYY